jgi:hypothetical protein
MTCDETELRWLDPKVSFDIGVSLSRRLMVLDTVRAEAPLEKIGNAAVFKLASLHLEQVIREGEQPPAARSLRSAGGTSGYGGIVENRSVSSLLSAPPILMPSASASIFMTEEPMSVNGT